MRTDPKGPAADGMTSVPWLIPSACVLSLFRWPRSHHARGGQEVPEVLFSRGVVLRSLVVILRLLVVFVCSERTLQMGGALMCASACVSLELRLGRARITSFGRRCTNVIISVGGFVSCLFVFDSSETPHVFFVFFTTDSPTFTNQCWARIQ